MLERHGCYFRQGRKKTRVKQYMSKKVKCTELKVRSTHGKGGWMANDIAEMTLTGINLGS